MRRSFELFDSFEFDVCFACTSCSLFCFTTTAYKSCQGAQVPYVDFEQLDNVLFALADDMGVPL